VLLPALTWTNCHVVQVYITVKGTKGKLPKRQLLQKSSGKRQGRFRFNKGTTHVFKFDAQDIGDITSVVVEVSTLHHGVFRLNRKLMGFPHSHFF